MPVHAPRDVAQDSYHHGGLRTALIASALAALERDGALPSWRALARDCNVSQSAPYRHFASLHDLRVAVVAAGFHQLTTAIRAAFAEHNSSRARMAAGCATYMRFGIEHPALYDVMFDGRGLLRDGEAGEAGRECYQTLVAAIAECGVANATGTAFIVWTAMHGLVDIVRAGGHPLSRTSARETASEIEMLIRDTLRMAESYVDRTLAHQRGGQSDTTAAKKTSS